MQVLYKLSLKFAAKFSHSRSGIFKSNIAFEQFVLLPFVTTTNSCVISWKFVKLNFAANQLNYSCVHNNACLDYVLLSGINMKAILLKIALNKTTCPRKHKTYNRFVIENFQISFAAHSFFSVHINSKQTVELFARNMEFNNVSFVFR